MHILCTICNDSVKQAENIQVIKCGHIFHYQCLSQWISRSKLCPQCRNMVTNRCMFRLYPTISNETSGEDVATLQAQLNDAQLQLQQQRTTHKEHKEKFAAAEVELKKNLALLKATEKKLESRDSAVSALKEQLEYVKIQNKETNRLKEENENLKKNIQTLNGLQKVLNATSEEVERMLEGYTDVRTVATFATALKRALCESESKKNESRDRLQTIKQQLASEKNHVADLQAKLIAAEEKLTSAQRKYDSLKNKRKVSDRLDKSLTEESWESAVKQMKPNEDLNSAIVLSDNNSSFNTMVNRIENADSPYLNLKQSSLALTALQRHPTHPLPEKNLKPSEYALLNSARSAVTRKPDLASAKTSIFQKREPAKIQFSQENDPNMSFMNISYDGLGGHSKLDTFPVPNTRPPLKSCVPKLSTKHKLKRPNPVGNRDISKMLEKIKDK
ncbi:E3 ubiquitin-protein ligase TRAIP isoform X2 [Nymphalis io]|uniref:E3 ubiquitin-protein ligase TRAIP isoform X2 n=2 Tax=Inachis io TaxID=171585 RepID=UPI002167EBC2|nr:E3 ubiquitin-protein ligase TRAIP isoform X2 [Nymphalis io]